MKKYFNVLSFFLLFGIMMPACNEKPDVSTTKKSPVNKKVMRMNRSSYNQLLEDLDDLDISFGLTSVSEISEFEGWDFTDIGGSWEVTAADANGACAGIGAGAAGGAAIGAAVGGPAGAAVGAATGTIVLGIVVGALNSIAEFQKEKEEEENNNTDELKAAINLTNPFAYYPQGNRFAYGSLTPIGSEIGELHNWLVSEMLADIDSTFNTMDALLEYVCTNNFTTLSTHYTSQLISVIQAYLYDNATDILSYTGDSGIALLGQEYPDEMDVIKHYAFVMTQSTTFFNRYQYTMDFMNIIDYMYQNESISEESALLINGTISTMYCSKTAWNYIQPDPFWVNNYIVCGNNSWYMTNNHEALSLLIGTSPDITFVGYPYMDSDTIKRIYIYAESPENVSLQNSIHSLLSDEVFTNTINSVTILENYRNCNPIETGIYPVLPAAGYDDYFYIDLEQRSDIPNN